MAKRWSLKEDMMIAAYGLEMADHVAEHDLKRPKGSGSARWKKLRDTGALDLIALADLSESGHYLAVGGSQEWDDDTLSRVEWLMRNARAIVEAMAAGEDLRRADGVANAVGGTASEEADHSEPVLH